MTVVEQIEDALNGEESVWVLLLADALHEDGEVVMVVELVDLDLPLDSVLGTVLDLDGKVASVVELTELRLGNRSGSVGSGLRGNDSRLLLGLLEGAGLSTDTLTLLKSSYKRRSLS